MCNIWRNVEHVNGGMFAARTNIGDDEDCKNQKQKKILPGLKTKAAISNDMLSQITNLQR